MTEEEYKFKHMKQEDIKEKDIVDDTKKEKRLANRREYYKKNKEKEVENGKRWREKHYEQWKEYMRRWANENYEKILERNLRKYPEKVKVRKITNNKIRKIPKGTICEICNKNLAVHKHHLDYSLPFLIKFVCRSCHNKIHICKKFAI